MFALIKNVCNRLSRAFRWLDGHSTAVVAIATVALTVITLFYLLETKKQRMLTQEAVWVQTSPRVFIKNIEPTLTADYKVSKLIVHTIITFSNCGTTEAKNITWSYIITQDGRELAKRTTRAPGIFPEQNRTTAIHDFRIDLPPKLMQVIQQAQEPNKPIDINPDVLTPYALKPFFLDIKLEYDNPDGKRMSIYQEQFEYLLAENKWVLPVQEY